MASNPYINRVDVVRGNTTDTLINISDTTATASDVSQGKYFYQANGQRVQGTSVGGSMVIHDEQDSHGGTIRHISAAETIQGTIEITDNGTYDVAQYADAEVSVQGAAPSLQAKTATPSTSQQVVTPDTGYDGLSQVTVNAMASGSAATPATTITANPTISVNSSTGVITASVSGSKSVTPTVSAGYVSSGTAGTVSVSGSNTSQLTTQAAKTVTPSTSSQTAVAAGRYTTGAVTVSAMPSGTAGTPTATKSISSHTATVTPSVTNTTGYITGSTKTGTAVTVSASELVSGTLEVTENGTVDVTNYASASIDVSSGGSAPILLYSGSLGEISTSSTSIETVTTIQLSTAAWTYQKMLYVTIWRTTNRNSTPGSLSTGGFLGTESMFWGGGAASGIAGDEGYYSSGCVSQIRYANGSYGVTQAAVGYGVYPSQLNRISGEDYVELTISKRYNSSYSGAVSGSYSIAVYLIDWPIGDPYIGRFS